MQLGPRVWTALRRALFDAMAEGSAHAALMRRCLVPQSEAVFSLPAQIGDYTDFYIFHSSTRRPSAACFGRIIRLLPNYKWIPIGYHGRSSSIAMSGQSFRRPQGPKIRRRRQPDGAGPSTRLDYELEMGIFIGAGNAVGTPIPMAEAENHIFGCACSTIGRRGICKAGNTSRWDRFWQKISRPPFRPGW